MSHLSINCSLIKKDGKIIGVSIVAETQEVSENFCRSIPKYLIDKSGIIFGDKKITFINPHEGEEVSFAINEKDATELKELLTEKWVKIGLYSDSAVGIGLKIAIIGMDKEGEKTKLEQC